jgi:hypothetical protein
MLLRALQRYAGATAGGSQTREERCELCSVPVGLRHPHVADLDERRLACACLACAILFRQPGAREGRYRTVPDRVLSDPATTLAESDWQQIEVPVRLAFFFFSSRANRWMALYPGPAGTTETELPAQAWADVSSNLSLISEVAPDVEALLAYARRGTTTAECFLVPITACYELTAKLRRHWRGFDGGDDARREIEQFFGELRSRARPLRRAGVEVSP